MKKSKKYRFTIIIPTFNRHEYLKRLLYYYNKIGFNYNFKIIVADSSSDQEKLLNQETINFCSNLDILYLNHFSEDTHPFNKQLFALGKVDTEYCVICPDDDFIMIKAINCAVDFFEINPTYTCVHGRYIRFYVKGKNKDKFYWHFTYSNKSIVDFDAQSRIIFYLAAPCNILFATYRTEFLKMIMGESDKYANDGFFGETLQITLPFIYGKMKILDIIYSPKDALSTPKNINLDHFNFLSDYKKDGTFRKRYLLFLECLSKHLSSCSGKSMEESKEFLNLTLLNYFEVNNRNLSLKFASFFHKIRIFLESIKIPKFLYNIIKWPYQKLFIRRGVKLLKEIPPSDYYDDLRDLKMFLMNEKG